MKHDPTNDERWYFVGRPYEISHWASQLGVGCRVLVRSGEGWQWVQNVCCHCESLDGK